MYRRAPAVPLCDIPIAAFATCPDQPVKLDIPVLLGSIIDVVARAFPRGIAVRMDQRL